MNRRQRLKKLVSVQEKLKAFHEMRHASFRAAAIAAEAEAAGLRESFDRPDSMSAMFPELYDRAIRRAEDRAARNRARAESEMARLATQTARTSIVERAWRDASREEERMYGERERLERISTTTTRVE